MISLVIPVYNESQVIDELVARLQKTARDLREDYEYVFVNDGSADDTLSRLLKLREKDKHIKVLNFSRNFGHQIAVSAGLNYAHGDAVIVMDADLQDPPEMIHQFVEKWKEGYDVVYAIRKKREGESLFKKVSCKIYYKLLRRMTDVDIPLDSGDFRLMSRRVIDLLNSMGEKRRYIRGLTAWIGFKQIGIEYIRPPRQAGETKYSLKKLTGLAWEGVTSMSVKPLHIAMYSGVFFSAVSFVYLVRVLYVRLFTQEYIEGWTSLMAVILLLGSIQLLCLGIIGEYIGRSAEEIRNRPLYIIDKVYE